VLAQTEPAQSIEVVWTLFQDLLVPDFGLGKLTELVVRQRAREQGRDIVTFAIRWGGVDRPQAFQAHPKVSLCRGDRLPESARAFAASRSPAGVKP
jgi:hypothetical protein